MRVRAMRNSDWRTILRTAPQAGLGVDIALFDTTCFSDVTYVPTILEYDFYLPRSEIPTYTIKHK